MRLNLKLNNIKNKIKAFTLAEILIVLSVIAIITAILLPAARNAMPNEDIVKFKKAHNAITTAIREMVNSDKYFLDGDIRVLPDGNCSNSRLVYVLADILNGAQVMGAGENGGSVVCSAEDIFEILSDETFEKFKTTMDNPSDSSGDSPVNVLSYMLMGVGAWSVIQISDEEYIAIANSRLNNNYYSIMYVNGYNPYEDGTFSGLDITRVSKIIAGQREGKFDTFTYAVRYDGKIITSSKVDEWLEKSIQEKD